MMQDTLNFIVTHSPIRSYYQPEPLTFIAYILIIILLTYLLKKIAVAKEVLLLLGSAITLAIYLTYPTTVYYFVTITAVWALIIPPILFTTLHYDKKE